MIQAVRGTKDLLPGEIEKWQNLEEIIRKVTSRYAYREIRTPIFEKTEVFSRSIGENTDIVNKEMYTFTDKGGDSITLRPEKTAALVRSVIQNNLTHDVSTLRLWYFGPFFRYERPQKGRLRQFHQFGAECISSPNPEADAEILMLACHLLKNLNINNYILELNSLGNDSSREAYRTALVKYFSQNKENLSEESQSRLQTNPLRILDSKSEIDKKVIENSPSILDYLDSESREHFEKVQMYLESADIKFNIEPRLVRGLDYYCHTVFEFKSSDLGAQDAFGGGGRYDGLFQQLESKSTPAVGFAMGIERLLLILEANDYFKNLSNECDIFIICTSENLYNDAIKTAEEMRKLKYKVVVDLQRRSFKAQMRESDKLSAKFCIIIGEDELSRNSVKIKNMKTGEQAEIKRNLLHTINFY